MKGIRSNVLLIFPLILSSLSIGAQETTPSQALQNALQELRTDIARDTGALNELRARIDAERTPLAERLETLRNQVAARRAELDRIREVRTRGERQQAELAARADALDEEIRYLQSLFSEYGRAAETRMNAARNPQITAALAIARDALDRQEELAPALREMVTASLRWNRSRIGGMSFQASALDEAGMEHPGTFATFGPAAYFASEAPEGPAGMAVLRFGTETPGLYDEFPPATLQAIRTVAKGGQAAVPIDATGGDAIRVAEASPGLIEQLKQGGYTMIPLAGVAAAALLLACWKAIDLSRMGVKDDVHVQAVLDALRADDPERARVHAEGIRRPLRQLVDDLIEHRNAPREHLEEIMYEHVLVSLPFIERNLGALAVLGGVAPLLGLLGTVTGMIHTFQLVTLFGSGDAKLLSGGISEALVTTNTGLAIAIPTLLIHAFLARRTRGIVGALESRAATMVNDLKLRNPAS
jgi:biopolymer transport protein ExbB